jgi:hypothetical protein
MHGGSTVRAKFLPFQWDLRLQQWLHERKRSLFKVSPGGTVEYCCQSVYLRLRAKFSLFGNCKEVRLQSWVRNTIRGMPNLSQRLLHFRGILRDLSSQFGPQQKHAEV